jgi:hypothetical protein
MAQPGAQQQSQLVTVIPAALREVVKQMGAAVGVKKCVRNAPMASAPPNA